MASDRGPRPWTTSSGCRVRGTRGLRSNSRRTCAAHGGCWEYRPSLVAAFVLLMTIGAALLTLPTASVSGDPTPLEHALFSLQYLPPQSTGHTVVSTPDYWSPFGPRSHIPAHAGRGAGIHGHQHVPAADLGRAHDHTAAGPDPGTNERRRGRKTDACHSIHLATGLS